eukprot:TRINITY_DN17734_c0_g3_i3.p1 TRINITY_DN17734_c0_g3~~TRINITY_DN17734_c0_g3_i3.p1  ORF type:complete len:334 (-),score=83.27 TRINITY_DN17734_c0_g3_i3:184-1185(-)
MMMILEDDALKSWLLKQSNWQSWVLETISDIAKETEDDDESTDLELLTLRLAMNLLTLVHFYVFCNESTETGDFSQVLLGTLKAIRSCNSSIPTRHIARIALSSMISKLQSSLRYFPPNAESPMWTNFFVVLALLRKFVFFTPKWDSAVSVILEDEKVEDSASVNLSEVNSPSKGGSIRSSVLSSRGRTTSTTTYSTRRKSSHGMDLIPLAAAFSVYQEDVNFMDMAEENCLVHCDSKGVPEDKLLISKTVKFMRLFKLNESDNISSIPQPHIERAQRELEFFTDSWQLLEALKLVHRTSQSSAEIVKCVDKFCKSRTSKDRAKVLTALSKLD